MLIWYNLHSVSRSFLSLTIVVTEWGFTGTWNGTGLSPKINVPRSETIFVILKARNRAPAAAATFFMTRLKHEWSRTSGPHNHLVREGMVPVTLILQIGTTKNPIRQDLVAIRAAASCRPSPVSGGGSRIRASCPFGGKYLIHLTTIAAA